MSLIQMPYPPHCMYSSPNTTVWLQKWLWSYSLDKFWFKCHKLNQYCYSEVEFVNCSVFLCMCVYIFVCM